MAADPWVLLREARDFMREVADSRGPCPDCTECDRRDAIIAKADAALAERADSATPVVEWEERQGSYIHDDGVNELRVYLWGDLWHWHTVVEYRANGIGTTEAEAKSAAIAAARGLK
jgi:hypothetical protein